MAAAVASSVRVAAPACRGIVREGSGFGVGEQLEEREPILRARIKVSPQMMKAIAVLATKHVREYEEAVGPISLPDQVFAAWELNPDGTSNVDGQGH